MMSIDEKPFAEALIEDISLALGRANGRMAIIRQTLGSILDLHDFELPTEVLEQLSECLNITQDQDIETFERAKAVSAKIRPSKIDYFALGVELTRIKTIENVKFDAKDSQVDSTKVQ